MNRKYTPTKEKLYDMYVLQDKTMKEISIELEIAVGKVYNLIKKYNIKSKTMDNKKWCERISKSKIGHTYNRGRKMSKEFRENLSIKKSKGIGKKKLTSTGYIKIYFPDHPKSDKFGYILEHDLIMECIIGRWLKDDEIVHHKNEIRTDNRKENLELMTRSEHSKYHRKKEKEKGMMTY